LKEISFSGFFDVISFYYSQKTDRILETKRDNLEHQKNLQRKQKLISSEWSEYKKRVIVSKFSSH
jgi:hypothetical protein